MTVLPLETVVADLEADHPGRWLSHCHNLYHSGSGMMAVLDYPARAAASRRVPRRPARG